MVYFLVPHSCCDYPCTQPDNFDIFSRSAECALVVTQTLGKVRAIQNFSQSLHAIDKFFDEAYIHLHVKFITNKLFQIHANELNILIFRVLHIYELFHIVVQKMLPKQRIGYILTCFQDLKAKLLQIYSQFFFHFYYF